MARSIESLSVQELAQACAEHEADYRRDGENSNTLPCYELFRRAVVEGDDSAWTIVYGLYEEQVLRWVRSVPAWRATNQEARYFVNAVFTRFWQAVSAEKFAEGLDSHGGVLLYLKRCVLSELMDYMRRVHNLQIDDEIEQLQAQQSDDLRPVERRVADSGRRRELWEYILKQTKDRREEVVVEHSFALNRRARHIQADFQDLFPDVNSVYRTKENLLKRLRRDPYLQKWLGGEI